jgi:1-acyl-sn-glycerol-3-phosphate acyltransferase
MKLFASFILWLFRWKYICNVTLDYQKFVIISAPHTSSWDFIWGRLSLWKAGIPTYFLIKKEWFKPPFGFIIRWMGGVAVDRSPGNSTIQDIIAQFEKRKKFALLITPEGTRKRVKHWKKGFHHIATGANVPILVGYIDYKKKETAVSFWFHPTGDYDKDLKTLEDFYRDKTAKYPELFNLTPEV